MKRVEQTLGGASLRSGRAGRDGGDSDGPPACHCRGRGVPGKMFKSRAIDSSRRGTFRIQQDRIERFLDSLVLA